MQKYERHINVKENRGITLIALVVTIVILIILAVISINAVFGENGLITSAQRAGVEHTHATVWEAMEMEYSNYWAGKVSKEYKDLIEYLQGKEIIDKVEVNGGYYIDTVKLLGQKVSLGNGDRTGSEDVYKLEPASSETADNTKLATVKDTIRIAESSTAKESSYQVKYYGPEGDKIRQDKILGVLGDNVKGLVESDNPNFHVEKTVVSTPDEGRNYYIVGEEVVYKIKVKNIGNVTITNVEIVDELVTQSGTYYPGDPEIKLKNDLEGRITAKNGKFSIGDLKAGEELEFQYGYEIQEGDIGGEIVNSITELTGVPRPTVPKGEKIPEVEIPTDEKGVSPDIDVEKTIISKPASGDRYQVGEEIVYQIKVTNIGNVKIESFEIIDKMISESIGSDGKIEHFESFTEPEGQTYLDIGETGYITYTYKVKAEDVGKRILNSVTGVETKPPTPPKGEKLPEVEIPPEEPDDRTFIIRKVDEYYRPLKGAVIEIYTDPECKHLYETIDLRENPTYNHSSDIPPNGKYYVKEIVVPDTYNMMDVTEFEITGKEYEEWVIVNTKGVGLPSTGDFASWSARPNLGWNFSFGENLDFRGDFFIYKVADLDYETWEYNWIGNVKVYMDQYYNGQKLDIYGKNNLWKLVNDPVDGPSFAISIDDVVKESGWDSELSTGKIISNASHYNASNEVYENGLYKNYGEIGGIYLVTTDGGFIYDNGVPAYKVTPYLLPLPNCPNPGLWGVGWDSWGGPSDYAVATGYYMELVGGGIRVTPEERSRKIDIETTYEGEIPDGKTETIIYEVKVDNNGETYSMIYSTDFEGPGTNTIQTDYIEIGSVVEVTQKYCGASSAPKTDEIQILVVDEGENVLYFANGPDIEKENIRGEALKDDFVYNKNGDWTHIQENKRNHSAYGLNIDEEFNNWTKSIKITNIDNEFVYVRAKVFWSTDYYYGLSNDRWMAGDDEWYYYDEPLERGMTADDLVVSINITSDGIDRQKITSVIVYEVVPAKVDREGNLYASWNAQSDEG